MQPMARIKIDPDRTIGSIDRRIFGNFIEHLGRCIYGGVFDEGSPLSDEHGFRRDVLEAARALQIPVLRWPGGNFVSGYHWTDGIGPVEQRPRRIELAWHSEEPNRFGTDEFLRYCGVLGTEPYICVNTGTGTIDEAQAWVEYCNGTGDTAWANRRRENGHPEPYRVRYWGLGNEMYGDWQIGALTAEEYVRKATEFAKVMKRTDPSIQLISCGRDGWSEWDRIVLHGLARYVEFHSIHLYTGSDDYYHNVFAPHQADRALRICQSLIEQVRYNERIAHPIHVAYDEWNVWFRARGAESALEERYTLADALAVATFLNIFIRHCQTVRMANLAQMVNVIAPIFTRPDGLFLQTIYHPLRLYAEHTEEVALDPFVECERMAIPSGNDDSSRLHRFNELGPFPLLDVAVSRDAAGQRLAVSVVNRDRERALPARIELTDAIAQPTIVAHEVNGPSVDAVNSFDEPRAVDVQKRSIEAGGAAFMYTFPAHSVTVLQVQMASPTP